MLQWQQTGLAFGNKECEAYIQFNYFLKSIPNEGICFYFHVRYKMVWMPAFCPPQTTTEDIWRLKYNCFYLANMDFGTCEWN